MTTETFVQQAVKSITEVLATVSAQLENATPNALNWKSDSTSWSALECLEHLNRYHAYYYPELLKAVTVKRNPTSHYTPRWLGKKFIGMIDPGKGKKMKTIRRMNPSTGNTSSNLSTTTLSTFKRNQQELLTLLPMLQQNDINKKAIPLEFFKLLKISIGDAFQFIIVHEQRHVQQAVRTLQQQY
jgi:hypothetical protein